MYLINMYLIKTKMSLLCTVCFVTSITDILITSFDQFNLRNWKINEKLNWECHI